MTGARFGVWLRAVLAVIVVGPFIVFAWDVCGVCVYLFGARAGRTPLGYQVLVLTAEAIVFAVVCGVFAKGTVLVSTPPEMPTGLRRVYVRALWLGMLAGVASAILAGWVGFVGVPVPHLSPETSPVAVWIVPPLAVFVAAFVGVLGRPGPNEGPAQDQTARAAEQLDEADKARPG